mmetsp:Transcript_128525/g.348899  ORF Transcript_128525/g.348899 Transcript_128525/m.348899 type:complete len:224 (-) Transcript_128525:234-905(-)
MSQMLPHCSGRGLPLKLEGSQLGSGAAWLPFALALSLALVLVLPFALASPRPAPEPSDLWPASAPASSKSSSSSSSSRAQAPMVSASSSAVAWYFRCAPSWTPSFCDTATAALEAPFTAFLDSLAALPAACRRLLGSFNFPDFFPCAKACAAFEPSRTAHRNPVSVFRSEIHPSGCSRRPLSLCCACRFTSSTTRMRVPASRLAILGLSSTSVCFTADRLVMV